MNPSPLFRLPLLSLGPYVLTGVMLGCAQGAYEAVVGAARKRNATTTGVPVNANPTVQIKVAEASARIDNAELIMRRACEHAMEVVRAGGETPHADKVRYRRDAFFSTRLCLEAVDILMTIAGLGRPLYDRQPAAAVPRRPCRQCTRDVLARHTGRHLRPARAGHGRHAAADVRKFLGYALGLKGVRRARIDQNHMLGGH